MEWEEMNRKFVEVAVIAFPDLAGKEDEIFRLAEKIRPKEDNNTTALVKAVHEIRYNLCHKPEARSE